MTMNSISRFVMISVATSLGGRLESEGEAITSPDAEHQRENTTNLQQDRHCTKHHKLEIQYRQSPHHNPSPLPSNLRINHLPNQLNNHGGNGMMGIHEGFHSLRQQSMPVDIGHGRMRQEHGMDGPHSNFIATSPPSRFFSPPPASSFNNLATIKPSSLYSRASASHAFNHTSNASSFAPFGNGHGLAMNQQFLGDMQYDHRDHLPMVIPPSPNPELTRAG